jgi:hypothetical protein
MYREALNLKRFDEPSLELSKIGKRAKEKGFETASKRVNLFGES